MTQSSWSVRDWLDSAVCALRLVRAGVEVVLEASDAVGGQVRTEVVDGFRWDRGFSC